MAFKLEAEFLNGIKVFSPDIFQDERGFFIESFRADYLEQFGLPIYFPQDNHSGSVYGVLRGLHFQHTPPMGKLIRATQGEIFLVEVDIRKNSPTLGQHVSLELSKANRKIVWIPPGFANGFCTVSDYAEVQYKCTAVYNPQGETGIRWNDPALGIKWPVGNPVLSGKDEKAQTLDEWLEKDEANLFSYQ